MSAEDERESGSGKIHLAQFLRGGGEAGRGDPVAGPRGLVAPGRDCEPTQAMTMMLDLVVDGLGNRGISGTLRPAREAAHQFFDRHPLPALGAMLMLPTSLETMLGSYDPYRP